jgi:hypothetical protein
VSTGPSSLRIDLVSDVVCPWCYIGFRGLLGAAALRPDVPIDLTLRAYQLDPDVPPEGADRKRRLLERFGSDAGRLAAIGEAVTESGRGVGIEFRFDRITLTPNTLDCHRLLRWASGAGLVVEAAEALFRAYFTEGEDLTQADTLVAIARGVGMDGARGGHPRGAGCGPPHGHHRCALLPVCRAVCRDGGAGAGQAGAGHRYGLGSQRKLSTWHIAGCWQWRRGAVAA